VTTQVLVDDETAALRDSVRTFLSRRVVPAYPEWRAAGRVPRELLHEAAESGFLAMRVPESHGGLGIDDPRFGAVVAQEAMAVGAPALALVLSELGEVVVPALVRSASDQLRERWLPGLASGEALAAVATGALDAGDGATVTGEAHFVVGGVDADLFLVLAGRQAVVVESGAAGLTVRPSQPSIGLAAAGLADLTFDGVAGERLGDASEPCIDLSLLHALTAVAGARAALALTAEYVLDRKAFGTPIATFENTRHAIAAASAQLDGADALARECLQQRVDGALAEPRAAAARLLCAEVYADVVDAGVQLHGGYGYMLEYPIAHAHADAAFWRLHGGAGGDLKEVVANSILGSR